MAVVDIVFCGFSVIRYDGYNGMMKSPPILIITNPIPSYGAVSPDTCVTLPLVLVNEWKYLIELNIFELEPPSSCPSTSLAIVFSNLCGYRRSHNNFSLKDLG